MAFRLDLNPLARPQRDLGRVTEIVKVLVRYGLADWMRPLPWGPLQDFFKNREGEAIAHMPVPERLRLAMTELGPTFIKLGQMLSTRPDLVGPELAGELTALQSDTPADPPEAVRQIIIEDLGAPPEEVFATFEPEAFASASIAQVHGAILRTGESVVVKVRKPGISRKIAADLSILAWLAELAENHAPQVKNYQPREVVRQFERSLQHEMDFNHERRNLEAFLRHFADDPTVHFPRPWSAFSSRRVLTMERLEGIPGNDAAALHSSGADLNAFALRGANLYLSMIFRDSFYHADPHPGNLMLLPGGVVGVLDCGMTGRLDERLRDEIENLLLAVAQSDPLSLAAAVSRLAASPGEGSREQLLAELTEFVGDHASRPLNEIELGPALNDLTGIIRRQHLTLPASVSLLLRTLVLLDGTAQLLSPRFSLAAVVQPYYRQALGRRFAPRRLLLRLQRNYRDWDALIQTLPNDLNEAVTRLRSGKFQVHLDHRHLDPVVNRLVLGIVVASLFLGSSLLWSMKAPPLLFGVSIFGAAGYLVAVWLGWRLFRSIKKSGDFDSRDE